MSTSQRSGSQASVSRAGALAATTREQRRSRRKRDVRACTISIKRMTQREVDSMRRIAQEQELLRPKQRLECVDGLRPCPYISCKYHLFLDVSPRTGSIKLNFPDLEVWEIPASCALDIADRGGTTLEDVGAIMNLTRERIRQLEVKALARLAAVGDVAELRELCGIQAVGSLRPGQHYDAEGDDNRTDDDEPDEFFDGPAASAEPHPSSEDDGPVQEDDAPDFFDENADHDLGFAPGERDAPRHEGADELFG